MVGIYQTTADKMYFNYVRPQENGHHTDTRWLNLSPDKGNGLVIVADSLIGFNALRNSVEDFDSEEALPHPYQWNNFSPEEAANHDEKAARNVLRRMHHVNDVTPRDFVEVCVDMKQQGVGGYDSWGALPNLSTRFPPTANTTGGSLWYQSVPAVRLPKPPNMIIDNLSINFKEKTHERFIKYCSQVQHPRYYHRD